jgi:arsenite methyltransferase
MSVPAMLGHLLLERLSSRLQPRIPEPTPIMDAPDQIAAFMQGGRDEGILTHIYFFHAVMSLSVIRPADTVLDLACGPANQLLHIARLHPETNFIGIDASSNMLSLAQSTLASNSIENVTLQVGEITKLKEIAAASIDCVLCTMSLHHLPDTTALHAAMREIRRALKPGGGIYLADFGRLKRAESQRFFAHDRKELQSPQFTDDFLHSMRAAFSIAEFSAATKELCIPLDHYQTALAPFMIICKSTSRRVIDTKLEKQIKSQYKNLTPLQKRDFNNIVRWFRIGGLSLPCAVY